MTTTRAERFQNLIDNVIHSIHMLEGTVNEHRESLKTCTRPINSDFVEKTLESIRIYEEAIKQRTEDVIVYQMMQRIMIKDEKEFSIMLAKEEEKLETEKKQK